MESSKSCTFLAFKYILIAILIVGIINLIVSIPATFAEDKDETLIDASRRTKALLTYGSNLIFSIVGLVGVARELFLLSLIVAIFMLVETILSLLIASSPSSILAVCFNAVTTIIAFAYSYLIRSISRSQAARVQPVTTTASVEAQTVELEDESKTEVK